MKADLWFPTIIWQGDLKQANNIELAEYVDKLQQESEGRQVSNYGGWQSEAQDLLAQKPVAVEVLLQGIQTSLNQCTKIVTFLACLLAQTKRYVVCTVHFLKSKKSKSTYNAPTLTLLEDYSVFFGAGAFFG